LREDIHGQNASLIDENVSGADGSEDEWPEMRIQQSEDMSVVTLG
jgi:hypothetical protein